MNISIYVINLESRPDRLDKVKKQLAKCGLSFERIDAVDGRVHSPDYYEHYDRAKRLKYFDDLVGGEIGCSESHFLALDTFQKKGKTDYCLVLEDDAILPENFVETLKTLTEKRSGWDLIRLQRSRKQKGVVVDKVDGHEIIFPFMVGLKTTALLYSKRGAEKTRNLYKCFIFPADHVLKFTHLFGIWTYETNPEYVDQDRDELGDIETVEKPLKGGIALRLKLWMKCYRVLGQGVRIFLMPSAYFRWKKLR